MSATTTTINGKEFIISRLLNAPATLVWDVWTKPEHIIKWWGPTGFTTTDKGMKVKVGGDWRFIMHGPDGRDYPNRIIFLEIEPKISVTIYFNSPGLTISAWSPNSIYHLAKPFREPDKNVISI